MKTRTSVYILLIAIVLININGACSKKNTTGPTTNTSGPYFARVKAIVAANCWNCHLSNGTWMGRPTAFDTDSSIAAQHASIKAAVADPVTFTNHRMPQTGTLSASDINIIVQWHNSGGRTSD